MASTDRGAPLCAADLMTPSPRTCSTFSTVLEAVMIMREEDCGAVPILEDGKPVGMVTDRDIALALADYPDLISRPVTEIMTRGIVSVGPNATVDGIKAAATGHGVRRVLVVQDDRLLGIIAWADVAPALSDREVGDVVSDIVTQPEES